MSWLLKCCAGVCAKCMGITTNVRCGERWVAFTFQCHMQKGGMLTDTGSGVDELDLVLLIFSLTNAGCNKNNLVHLAS